MAGSHFSTELCVVPVAPPVGMRVVRANHIETINELTTAEPGRSAGIAGLPLRLACGQRVDSYVYCNTRSNVMLEMRGLFPDIRPS